MSDFIPRTSPRRTALIAFALSISMGACDRASPAEPPMGPVSASTSLATDEDYAALLRARIYNPSTVVALSAVPDIGARGKHRFTGSKGVVKTTLDVSFEGSHRHRLEDTAEYNETIWDWLSEGLGYCSTYSQLANGEIITCPHDVEIDVRPIGLESTCGFSGRATSDHSAQMLVKGKNWGKVSTTSGDRKSQQRCPSVYEADDGRGDFDQTHNDGNQESDGGGSTCSTARCGTWYWYDPATGAILEPISTQCTCLTWS